MENKTFKGTLLDKKKTINDPFTQENIERQIKWNCDITDSSYELHVVTVKKLLRSPCDVL